MPAALKDVLKADEDIDEAPCRVAAEFLESLVEEEHGQQCVDYACQAATEPPQQANYTSLPRIPPSPRAETGETRHESHEPGQGPPHAIAHAYPLIKAPWAPRAAGDALCARWCSTGPATSA